MENFKNMKPVYGQNLIYLKDLQDAVEWDAYIQAWVFKRTPELLPVYTKAELTDTEGQWNWPIGGPITCPICGYEAANRRTCVPAKIRKAMSPYCPQCGARLKAVKVN